MKRLVLIFMVSSTVAFGWDIRINDGVAKFPKYKVIWDVSGSSKIARGLWDVRSFGAIAWDDSEMMQITGTLKSYNIAYSTSVIVVPPGVRATSESSRATTRSSILKFTGQAGMSR